MQTKRQTGFVLMAVVAIIMMAALVVLLQAVLQRTQRTTNLQTAEIADFNNLDAALANFVAQNKRLPCPADGTKAITAPLAGYEQPQPVAASGACGNQQYGVVPWVTLGLPVSAVIDASGNQITYRVDPSLTAIFAAAPPNPAPGPYYAMDMTNCIAGLGAAAINAQVNTLPAITYPLCNMTIPCGAACTGQSNALAGKGLSVSNGSVLVAASGTTTGAAYVLISHGQNQYGAMTSQGTVLVPPPLPLYPLEQNNYNGQVLVMPQIPAKAFYDAPFNNTAAAAPAGVYFDDRIHYPTILAVLAKANLNPRN